MNIFMYYKILSAHPGMTDEEIKARHRTLSQRLHPDRVDGDPQLFMDVQTAFRALRTAKDRSVFALRLSGLGSPCTRCDGRGYTRQTKRFIVVGITPCEFCGCCGYVPHGESS